MAIRLTSTALIMTALEAGAQRLGYKSVYKKAEDFIIQKGALITSNIINFPATPHTKHQEKQAAMEHEHVNQLSGGNR